MNVKECQLTRLDKARDEFRKSYPGKKFSNEDEVIRYYKKLFKGKRFRSKFPKYFFDLFLEGQHTKNGKDSYGVKRMSSHWEILPYWRCNPVSLDIKDEVALLYNLSSLLLEEYLIKDELAKNMLVLVQNRMGVQAATYLEECYKGFKVKYKTSKKK